MGLRLGARGWSAGASGGKGVTMNIVSRRRLGLEVGGYTLEARVQGLEVISWRLEDTQCRLESRGWWLEDNGWWLRCLFSKPCMVCQSCDGLIL